MSETEILVQKVENRLHAALLRDKKVIDLYVDSGPEHAKWASIYLARVETLDKALNGAFVSLGGQHTGFLPAKHVVKKGKTDKNAKIQNILEPGKMILVQVKSEAKPKSQFESHKHPRVSMKIYLPGRQLFFKPYGESGVSLSDSLKNANTASLVAKLEKFGGWCFHGNAESVDIEELKGEARGLLTVWKGIREALEHSSQNTRLLYMGPNALQRLIIDYAIHKFSRLEISEKANPNAVKAWLKEHASYLLDRITISEDHKIDLFELRDVYGVLGQAHSPLVPLPSGGSIVIDTAHAMTVIDVNKGSDTRSILEINKEAAFEIVRQIKLRNLSGAILIDFINMRLKTERYELIQFLKKCLDIDPANTVAHGFTRLGILEITRTRRTATLGEKTAN